MQAGFWGASAIALIVAGVAILADRRRNRRSNLDAVGFMPWPLILVLALMVAAVAAAIALKG